MTDVEIVTKFKSGDKTVFKELVHQYKNRIINTCYRFLLNREDATDISQEVFIEIFQSLHSFRGESKLSTWIYRIAVSKCLDEIKRRNRKKRISSIGKILHLEEVMDWFGGGNRPDRAIREKERLQEVLEALNKLPDNQRIAFTLSKIDGYTNQEIAAIMNTTLTGVESLIYRAKKRTSEELENILKKSED